MRRAIPFAALILVAALVLSGFSSQEVVSGRRRASAAPSLDVSNYKAAAGHYGSSPNTTTIVMGSLTSGDLIIIFASSDAAVSAWTTPTGSGAGCTSLTYTSRGSPSLTSDSTAAWTAIAGGSGACTITIGNTLASGNNSLSGGAWELKNGTNTFDAISTLNSTSSYSDICTSCSYASGVPPLQTVTTGGSNHMVLQFAVSSAIDPNGKISVPNPFTIQNNAGDGTGYDVIMGYYLKAAAGTYQQSWTAASSTHYRNAAIAVY